MTIVFCDRTTPLGPIRLAANEDGLYGCYFHGQKHFPNPCKWQLVDYHPILMQTHDILQHYFAGRGMIGDIELAMSGTEFQLGVWRALLLIPYASVICYSDLATQLGRPRSTRAVAAAVGRNPISIIVPCHRVIGKNGSLTGYAGGLQRKQQLLKIEKRDL